ncbi:MAG: hypothetical protein MSS80_05220 [Mollicutes bacterium]|nr:hypothetical protein [Mollicutes bacterium]
MEEKEQKEKELQQFEEQDGLSISTKINELAMTLTARVEAVNIVTEVLNSWLNVRQSNEKIKLSEKEIAAIQAAINQANNKTNELFNELTTVSEELIKSREKK